MQSPDCHRSTRSYLRRFWITEMNFSQMEMISRFFRLCEPGQGCHASMEKPSSSYARYKGDGFPEKESE